MCICKVSPLLYYVTPLSFSHLIAGCLLSAVAGRHNRYTCVDAHTQTLLTHIPHRIAYMSAAHTDCLFTRGTAQRATYSIAWFPDARTKVHTPVQWSVLISCRRHGCPVYFHMGLLVVYLCVAALFLLIMVSRKGMPFQHTAFLFPFCEVNNPHGLVSL